MSASAVKPDERRKTNEHAGWISIHEFRELARDFYGTKVLMFDRTFAQQVLEEFNTGNRRVIRRKVDHLVAQMRSGEFENTGEPLIISQEGILNDGQHRLQAAIEADAVVDLDVRFGIPRSRFTKTDTGAARTPADVLTIKGVHHGRETARAVRLLILYRRGLPDSIREFVSNDEVARAFDAWKGLADVAERVGDHAFPRSVRGAALLATAYLASRSTSRVRLDDWLETLASGVGSGRDDPAYVARERIMRDAEAPSGTRELLLERLALLIKSWNAYASGETVTTRDLKWRHGGREPEPFPRVEGVRLAVPAEPAAAG